MGNKLLKTFSLSQEAFDMVLMDDPEFVIIVKDINNYVYGSSSKNPIFVNKARNKMVLVQKRLEILGHKAPNNWVQCICVCNKDQISPIEKASSREKTNGYIKMETLRYFLKDLAKGNEMTRNDCSLAMPQNYVVFDLETTGLSPKKAEIIEIGAVRVKNGKIAEKFQSYVKPYGPIPPNITELTGITEKMTENAPRIEDALPLFFDFIKDDILFAHNSSFDCRFIGTVCLLLGLDPKNEVRDSLTLARKYINSENHKLETLKNYLGIKRKSHNAVDDCIVTFEVIEECRRKSMLLETE